MYDILQLNDMLVPELLDIAEQQSISNANKLEKQELIYKILDKQAIMNNPEKKDGEIEKPKRKRITKAVVEETPKEVPVVEEPHKEIKHKKTEEKKKPAKRPREEESEIYSEEKSNDEIKLGDP